MSYGPFLKFVRPLLISMLFVLAACAGPDAPASAPQSTNGAAPLTVVATYSILGDLAANVGGEHVQLLTLVGPDGDAHTFEPTPADSVALTKAALIFENGLEFEGWLDDLYSASGADADRIVVTKDVELLTLGEMAHDHAEEAHTDEEAHAGEEAEADEHQQVEFDPHVWHSVANVMQMVATIGDALSAADPAHADAYAANADHYLAELAELDAWVQERVATLPAERRKLVTSHDTFSYFAAAYGFEVIGAAVGASTEASDPSARELAQLIETIKAEAVPAIFAENVANPQLIEQIAQETGVAIGPLLYTDALGEAGSDGDSYIKMMRYNVNAIVSALAQ